MLENKQTQKVYIGSSQPQKLHLIYGKLQIFTNFNKLQVLVTTLLLAHSEPKSTKTALSNPTWFAAMKTGYDASMKNGT